MPCSVFSTNAIYFSKNEKIDQLIWCTKGETSLLTDLGNCGLWLFYGNNLIWFKQQQFFHFGKSASMYAMSRSKIFIYLEQITTSLLRNSHQENYMHYGKEANKFKTVEMLRPKLVLFYFIF